MLEIARKNREVQGIAVRDALGEISGVTRYPVFCRLGGRVSGACGCAFCCGIFACAGMLLVADVWDTVCCRTLCGAGSLQEMRESDVDRFGSFEKEYNTKVE